jgi:hypothetical protein
MDAKNQRVVDVLRIAIGDPAERGVKSKIARAVEVEPSTVSRWTKSMPDPKLWPAIEDAVGLTRGTLQNAYDGELTPALRGNDRIQQIVAALALLTRRFDDLERQVAEQSRQLDAQAVRLDSLDRG